MKDLRKTSPFFFVFHPGLMEMGSLSLFLLSEAHVRLTLHIYFFYYYFLKGNMPFFFWNKGHLAFVISIGCAAFHLKSRAAHLYIYIYILYFFYFLLFFLFHFTFLFLFILFSISIFFSTLLFGLLKIFSYILFSWQPYLQVNRIKNKILCFILSH
jgi:hypothetical protein